MTERIDHAAEAKRLEQNAWQRGGPLGDQLIRTHEQRQEMILSAQVHATLALVEQQRIANRIAMAVAIRGDLELADSASNLSDWLHEGNGVLGYFSDAEREGLGLA